MEEKKQSGGTFSRLLNAAAKEVKEETREAVFVDRSLVLPNGIISEVLDYLDELDDEGFEELFEFETRCWRLFDSDDDEHKLEFTKAHEEYAALLESKIVGFLETKHCSVDKFYQLVREEMADTESEIKEDAAELVHMLHEASDYMEWYERMRFTARCRSER